MQQVKRGATRQIDVTVVMVMTTQAVMSVAASLASWNRGRRTACVQASQAQERRARENEAPALPGQGPFETQQPLLSDFPR